MTQAAAQTFPAGEPDAPALSVLGRRVEALDVLDAPAEKVSEMVRGLLPPGAVKDLISGTWLGHALHPVLSDVPIGSWQSAAVLDLLGGRRSEPAADLLIAVGLAASAPTALSGISDWADTTLTSDAVKRVGAAHAIGNTATVLLYAASLAARRRGNRRRGRLLGLLGVGSLAGGAWLGGHLSFSQGVGVDVTAFTPAPTDWTPALAESDLPPEGQAVRGQAGDLPVLLARDAGQIRCLIDACDHRGGPLHEGTIEDGCVTCPWHASIFRLSDGAVLQGPATAPQPALDVRLNDGNVEVRAPGGA